MTSIDDKLILEKMGLEDIVRLRESVTKKNRRITEKKYKRKQQNRHGETYYLAPYYSSEDKNNKEYIIKQDMPRKKCHKKLSNKIVRKYKGDLQKGANYKKLYDLWWILY